MATRMAINQHEIMGLICFQKIQPLDFFPSFVSGKLRKIHTNNPKKAGYFPIILRLIC